MDMALIKNIHKEVGFIFYDLRVKNGYSLNALARELGLSPPSISHKEKGSYRITLSDILLYASFFSLHPSDILSIAEQRALARSTQ